MERATRERGPLSPSEVRAVRIYILDPRVLSDTTIARWTGVHSKTVARMRKRLGLPQSTATRGPNL